MDYRTVNKGNIIVHIDGMPGMYAADARSYLIRLGFSWDEANQYIRALPRKTET